jgi:hypothetical protein
MKNIVHVIYPDEAVHSFVMDTDMVVSDILERVFAEWNHGSGMESELFIRSKKRSLCVGDVVCVNGRYHLCKSFGWKEVTSQFVNELEEEVRNHPNRIQGAWFALNGVMQGMRARETKNNLELV